MKNIIAVAGIILVIIVAVVFLSNNGEPAVSQKSSITTSPTSTPQIQSDGIESETLGMKQYAKVPEIFLSSGRDYVVTLNTNKGDIKIKLFQNEVPVAANNFAFLAKDGFYDGVVFHRVVKGFMIQGGDPTGTGMGGPGYSFEDEPVTRSYDRGVVAYANSGADTNGSQFFIMHADYPLPPQYVIFGEVTDGMDTVDAIAGSKVMINDSGSEVSKPVETIVITSATLAEE